jgi:HlyD family secretion protein
MKRGLIIVLSLFVVAVVAAAGYVGSRSAQQRDASVVAAPQTVRVTRGDVSQTVTAPGRLVGTRRALLGFEVTGRLLELPVRPGERVRQGDLLARLEPRPFEEALQEARLKLERVQAERVRQIAEAQASVEMAQARLRQAEADRLYQLADSEIAAQNAEARLAEARLQYPGLTAVEVELKNAISQEAYAQDEYKKALDRPWEPAGVTEGFLRALDDARDHLAIAQAQYKAAQSAQVAASHELQILESEVKRAKAAHERLGAGVDPLLALDIRTAEETLADLSATEVDPILRLAVARAESDLAAATLNAPFDGVVLRVQTNLYENVGPGVAVVLLEDPDAVEVEATAIEEDLPLIQAGQSAELFFDALPEASVGGQVARISPLRTSDERPLYPVYIAMDDLPRGLAPGMTVDASIVIARRADVLRLPRALVRARSDGTAQVKVWIAGQVGTRTVRVGLRGDVYVEIAEGLREDDQVVAE